MQYVRIPRERISILVGKNGSVKRKIEKMTGVHLKIDSEEGTVDIDEGKAEDPIYSLKVRDLVRAIGRGFNPEAAMEIVTKDMFFSLVDIRDYTGKKPKRIREMKGRIIGKEGKTKRIIQDLAGCSLCIYGHTVGIIAELDGMEIARTAVDMVLSGSRHASVYGYLERKRREAKSARARFMYGSDPELAALGDDYFDEITLSHSHDFDVGRGDEGDDVDDDDDDRENDDHEDADGGDDGDEK